MVTYCQEQGPYFEMEFKFCIGEVANQKNDLRLKNCCILRKHTVLKKFYVV